MGWRFVCITFEIATEPSFFRYNSIFWMQDLTWWANTISWRYVLFIWSIYLDALIRFSCVFRSFCFEQSAAQGRRLIRSQKKKKTKKQVPQFISDMNFGKFLCIETNFFMMPANVALTVVPTPTGDRITLVKCEFQDQRDNGFYLAQIQSVASAWQIRHNRRTQKYIFSLLSLNLLAPATRKAYSNRDAAIRAHRYLMTHAYHHCPLPQGT